MDLATTFQERKQEVMHSFESAISLARDVARKDAEDSLQETKDRFAKEQLYVVVCGEFKQGKSSFINALLEEPGLCPVDILVTTSLVSTIGYASEEKITVYLGQPGNAKPKEIGRNEIANYVSEQRNRRNRQNARLLTVETPNEHLKSGLLLVDTPGVGGVYAEHSSITYGFVPNADVVLFVSDALKPLSRVELDFVAQVAEHCRNLIFVVTKKDKTPSLQQILEDNRAKLSRVLNRPPDEISITAVSNLLKERYLQSRKPEDLEDSNFPAFERELWGFLGEQRGQILLMRALDALGESVADMRAPYQAEWEAYQDHTEQELSEIEQELTGARDALRELSDNSAQWRQDLSDGLAGIRKEILERSFEEGKVNIRSRIHQYLLDDNLVRQPLVLNERVAADLNLMMNTLGQEIAARAAELQREVETSSKLDLNPFKSDRPFREIAPPSASPRAWGAPTGIEIAVDAAKRSVLEGGSTSIVGAMLGGIVGSTAAAFTAGGTTAAAAAMTAATAGSLVAAPVVVTGVAVGGAIGAIVGVTKAVQNSLRDASALAYNERKKATEEAIWPSVESSFRLCAISLDRALAELDGAMRNDLENKIKREERSLNQSIKQFQEGRQASEEDAAVKRDELSLMLERFDRLQTQLQATARTVLGTLEPVQPPASDGKANRGEVVDERNDLT
jgi:GTPase Era involved in 16S rRNA processing